MRGALGGPRVLLRRLREVMAEPVSAQDRLDKIVVLIAANMVAEVCSVYVLRVDGTLERPETLVRIAGALGELQSYAALRPLERLFGHPLPVVRRAAVIALRYLHFKRSFAMVRRALVDPDDGVQKAALAGCPVLVGVGAPSSLAVELAEAQGITLCGWARADRLSVYAHAGRVTT